MDGDTYGQVTLEELDRADGARVILIGTCHVSTKAADYTAARIRRERPSAVVLELCEERRHMLRETQAAPPLEHGGARDTSEAMARVAADWTEMISMLYRSAEVLMERQPGREFAAAAAAAEDTGARVILGDRRASVTLARMKARTPFWELVITTPAQFDQDAKDAIARSQALESARNALAPRTAPAAEGAPKSAPGDGVDAQQLQEARALVSRAAELSALDAANGVMWLMLRKFWAREAFGPDDRERLAWAADQMALVDPLEDKGMPRGMRTVLIDERDQLLADAVRRAPGPKVVAVLGAAHLRGVRKALDGPPRAESELDEFRSLPAWRPRPWHAVMAAGVGGASLLTYRSRSFRQGLALAAVGAGVGATWLVAEVSDRLQHLQRTLSLQGGPGGGA